MAYKCLLKQLFKFGAYSLVPIRNNDRYDIMKWRNEQIYHLRQNKPLTEKDQENYFSNVVNKLFELDQPDQILFSFLQNDVCVGYGGLVHINWTDKNAEVSFLINTELEKKHFQTYWTTYLSLIEEVAFKELGLHKIYTYAFDVRPNLYKVLEQCGYYKDAELNEHVLFHDQYINVIIHAKLNVIYELRIADLKDIDITFEWVNNYKIREYSINRSEVTREEHNAWFKKKIQNTKCKYYILTCDNIPVGSIRFDIDAKNDAQISYLIDPKYQGKKLGNYILKNGIKKLCSENKPIDKVYGYVMKENLASVKAFEKLNFNTVDSENQLLKFTKIIAHENS
jgi:RimJ/RimL family protein N-acetyltransferase